MRCRAAAYLVVVSTLVIAAPGCAKKYRGRTQPTSDTAWHHCELVPDARPKPARGAGTLGFAVRCTAKQALWIHDVEAVLYDGDKPSNLGPRQMLAEDEKIELDASKSGERRGSFEVSDLARPWVIRARISFGYPGSIDVDHMEAEMEAHDKDTRDNPTKFRIELSAAVE